MLQDENVKGKKSLEYVLWINTVKPKLNVGDIIGYTDYGRTIGGKKIVKWKATVDKITFSKLDGFAINYELLVEYKVNDEIKTLKAYTHETKNSLGYVRGYSKDWMIEDALNNDDAISVSL